MKIISWNVNGIRAIEKKGFVSWFEEEAPDILCLQEVKATEEQIPKSFAALESKYHRYWHAAQRKGYSGVAVFSKDEPIRVKTRLGIDRFDDEGRIIECEYSTFHLFNVYFPNGGQGPDRVAYKLEFYEMLLKYMQQVIESGKHVVLTGDFNTAHTEIDLARPKQNTTTSGFLPEEREWIDRYLNAGFVDCFRDFEEGPEHYTWWSYRRQARDRNVGWRIDYFMVNQGFRQSVVNCRHHTETKGSDHCPLELELSL